MRHSDPVQYSLTIADWSVVLYRPEYHHLVFKGNVANLVCTQERRISSRVDPGDQLFTIKFIGAAIGVVFARKACRHLFSAIAQDTN